MIDSSALASSPTASPSRKATLAWIALYLALAGGLAYGVFAGLRLRCEGFGCMGVGVYWFAWACVYAATGLLGLWVRSRTVRAGLAVGLVRVAVWMQLLGGLALFARWLWLR